MKILCIVAHPDDCEYEMGGLAALYSEKGHKVRFLSACNGCGGHHIMTPEETVKRRRIESDKVAEMLGVEYDIFADSNDCEIMPTLEMRRRFIRYIREFSPDIIITHRPNDYHADHRAVGQLVQDASYMLTVPHDCHDTPAMRRMPVIMYHEDNFSNPPFRADIVIGIDSVIEKKLGALNLHESQVYEWLPYVDNDPRPVPPASEPEERFRWLRGAEVDADTTDEELLKEDGKFINNSGIVHRSAIPAAKHRTKLIERYGEAAGAKVRFAEAFEVCEYGLQLTEEMKKTLFPY